MKKRIIPALIGASMAVFFAPVHAAEDLNRIYDFAKQYDPTFLNAATNVKVVAENVDQAQSVMLPQVNLTSSFNRTNGDAHDETFNATLGLSQQVFRWDYWTQLDISEKQAEQAKVDYQFALQELIFRVSSAYFDVLRAQDDFIFSQAELNSVERQLEQTKQRFEVGLTAITDVHEAQASFDQAKASLILAELNVDNAFERLSEITGQDHSDLFTLNTDRFSTSRPTPDKADDWQALAEERSLPIASSKMSLDIAEESIGLAETGHYPTLDFNASLRANDFNDRDAFVNDNGNLIDQSFRSDTSVVGLQLNVPIYSGGGTSSQVRQAQHNYVIASQNLELTHRQITRNVRVSYNTVIANISGIQALEQTVVSAESALRATEAGFEVGTRTIVDVLDSTRNLYNAKRNLSQSRYDYIVAVLALKGSAGTLTEQDVNDVNSGLVEQAELSE